jgi:hypothetical protein
MFSKCANPDCTTPFSYREGQLVRFQRNHSGALDASETTKAVRHFWLCKRCSKTHRLEYDKHHGLLLIVRSPNVLAANHNSRLIAVA